MGRGQNEDVCMFDVLRGVEREDYYCFLSENERCKGSRIVIYLMNGMLTVMKECVPLSVHYMMWKM
jgi:hypothetical protein